MNEEDREMLRQTLQNVRGTKRFLGFTMQELSILGAILVGIVAFYLRTDDTMTRLVSLGEYTKDFMANSDVYHSAQTGVVFKQGKPTNDRFDVRKAHAATTGGNEQ